ncbi:MAG: UDP-N-acetylmuramate dehydrogenase [Myxococcales bacterium]|nr:UDP-N-acetylmuramate dehydrogenase [Myxococcales bacterium]
MREFVDEPLSRHGYWRVGGPLERLVVVETAAELAALADVRLVLGNGSNLLIPDTGLPGTTVRLGGEFRGLEVLGEGPDGVILRAGAGLLNTVLLARVRRLGLGGLACLAGVPGSVGGAVAMNAGTALGELADCLVAVIGLDGQRVERKLLPMSYRQGGLPRDFVVVAAELRASPDGVDAERQRIAHHLTRRKATQPLDLPSCGSVFQNPAGDHAGRLIESVGLKGWRSGAAELSAQHANFIVNHGGASALDVMTCLHTAWSRVRQQTGVALVPEVQVFGAWPPELWPLIPPTA